MLKSELLELLKDIGEDADINETIQGVKGLTKTSDIKTIGLDDFKSVLETNDIAKSYFQSSLDSGIDKGVATYKENFMKNELPKLVDDGIKSKSNEGKSEIEIKYEEMQKQLDTMVAEKAKAEMANKFTKELSTKGLPTDLIDFVLGSNEETTNSNIEKISTILNSATDLKVKEKLGESTYVPPKNDGVVGKITWEQVQENPNLMAQYNQQS